MRLTVIRDETNGVSPPDASVLRSALSMRPLSDVILSGAIHLCDGTDGSGGFFALAGASTPGEMVWDLPASWPCDPISDLAQGSVRITRNGSGVEPLGNIRLHPWVIISDGRFVARVSDRLSALFSETSADAMAVTADPGLLAYRERIRLTEKGELVGYRRLYRDSIEPMPMPAGWPHYFVVRSERFEAVLGDGLPRGFDEMVQRCRSCGMKVEAVSVAGLAIDLASPEGLLTLSDAVLTHCPPQAAVLEASLGRQVYVCGGDRKVSDRARFVGPVLLGSGVCVEPDAVVVGPTVLCDGCTVRRGALVDSSILGTRAVVQSDDRLDRSVVMGSNGEPSAPRVYSSPAVRPWAKPAWSQRHSAFRTWSRFSYPGCFKRMADVLIAVFVLVLFAPIAPFIALAIKINSPGPVFYRDRRQGLHGRLFGCVKFRTMRVGAAEIQDKLRFVSEVDGPQFKMADDPRISTVGHFLRETYLDEIPQFFNVLCGQMSVVGPRPSPETENTLCPSWRDARLSVRPGITGLWQVFRTREPFKDFQEWIYYDTKYVQELSPRMDLWVCWCTFRKMVGNFIRQF